MRKTNDPDNPKATKVKQQIEHGEEERGSKEGNQEPDDEKLL